MPHKKTIQMKTRTAVNFSNVNYIKCDKSKNVMNEEIPVIIINCKGGSLEIEFSTNENCEIAYMYLLDVMRFPFKIVEFPLPAELFKQKA
jgi:hypothetical protein